MEEFEHEQTDSEGNFVLTKTGLNEEDHGLPRKLRQEEIDKILTTKSDIRQNVCWSLGCENKSSVWVREIQFDMKGDKVGINQHVVSTSDYNGPVPGFCNAHIVLGPTELAEKVYWDKTEIYLGLRPRKWWVIFTDGTKQGGLCELLNPKSLKPRTNDVHCKNQTI